MVALVAAIVMVVAALLIRSRIDEESSSDGTARLVCATELEVACLDLDESVGGLEVTIEPAGTTAARLIGLPDTDIDDPGFDGWLVPQPWPGIVDSTRARDQLRPVLAPDTEVLARSPLVIAMRDDREEALRGVCEGPVAWPCLGDVAGTTWSDLGATFPSTVKVAHTNPTVSAAGLLVLAQATSEFFDGRTDFFLADIESDEYIRWLTRLEDSAEPSAAPFDEMLGKFPTAVYDAVGTTEAEAGPELAQASRDRRSAFTLLYPDRVATAGVVLALAAGDDRDDDIRDVAAGGSARSALAADGWRVDDEPLAPGLDRDLRLPAGTNLPSDPGVYVALQDAWRQAAR